MAEFLTTKGMASAIENLIIEAKEKLIIVSPYLQVSETFQRRLKDASTRGITVQILYGKDKLKSVEKTKLKEISNLELYYVPKLHAKCYINEQHLIIGSMNFYEFSEANNIEMGMLFDAITDKAAYDKAMREVDSWLINFKKEELIKDKKAIQFSTNTKGSGICIRCHTDIKLDPGKPYCPSCYTSWAEYGNPTYIENYCHICWKPHETSMMKPICNSCYKDWVRKHPYAVM